MRGKPRVKFLPIDVEVVSRTYALAENGLRRVDGEPMRRHISPKGYSMVYVPGAGTKCNQMEHRLVYALANGSCPDAQIDHKDRDKSNNRPSNLRVATREENMQNVSEARCSSSSGLLGVWRTANKAKPWVSTLRVGGKRFHLGVFRTKEEAHEAYMQAKERHHPGFVPAEVVA